MFQTFLLSHMKKIEDFYFTVAKILSSARNFEQFHFFRSRFFCRAVDIFKKSVEQLRFEQLHFEQLTLTLHFLFSYVAGFYKPTALKVYPPI
jgi:hypothetical protein